MRCWPVAPLSEREPVPRQATCYSCSKGRAGAADTSEVDCLELEKVGSSGDGSGRAAAVVHASFVLTPGLVVLFAVPGANNEVAGFTGRGTQQLEAL